MKHRHLADHDYWSNAKIDDVLARGTLADWLELRDAMIGDLDLAARTLAIARATDYYGTSVLWRHYIARYHPEASS